MTSICRVGKVSQHTRLTPWCCLPVCVCLSVPVCLRKHNNTAHGWCMDMHNNRKIEFSESPPQSLVCNGVGPTLQGVT